MTSLEILDHLIRYVRLREDLHIVLALERRDAGCRQCRSAEDPRVAGDLLGTGPTARRLLRRRRAAQSPRLPLLCRFSDAGNDPAPPHAGRPASEKRQGTKSREGGALSVPPALWGFGRGVRLGEVGSNWPLQSLCLKRPVWVTGGTRAAGAAGGEWSREIGPL
jgi:hypothetical protein